MREIEFRAWDGVNKIMIGPFWVGSELSMLWPPEMQYTGLHDKNGKEIYEADVVQSRQDFGDDDYPDMRDLIEVVEYADGAFYPICNMPMVEFEVIGNVYENPELPMDK